jgi:hypothetical protein
MNVPCITEASIKIASIKPHNPLLTVGYQPLCAAYSSDLAAIAASIHVQCRILN